MILSQWSRPEASPRSHSPHHLPTDFYHLGEVALLKKSVLLGLNLQGTVRRKGKRYRDRNRHPSFWKTCSNLSLERAVHAVSVSDWTAKIPIKTANREVTMLTTLWRRPFIPTENENQKFPSQTMLKVGAKARRPSLPR